MNQIETSTSLSGQIASGGVAAGPLHIEWQNTDLELMQGTPDEESDLLAGAIDAASAGLAALMAAQDDEEAAEMLEFQLAMIEDDALSEPARDAIEAGAAAATAWRETMNAQIDDYAKSDDPYFRARSADLTDLSDRVMRHIAGNPETIAVPHGAVLHGEDLTPSRFLETDWSKGGGIALAAGSVSSHVAILARARGVPMLVGLGRMADRDGETVVLDAEAGRLILSPSAEVLRHAEERHTAGAAEREANAKFLDGPAITADGNRILIMINAEQPEGLAAADPTHCDGIGLVRTEFLFGAGPELPDEDTQCTTYRRFLDWTRDRPVTIRTLDAGGDKPIAGLTPGGEGNPFLGVRGLRLSLQRPEILRVQLRALARAAIAGNLKIMLPMVTTPAEFAAGRSMLQDCVADLEESGVPAVLPPLGMMVEVPAAALAISAFDADFYSIGSNDLIQYTTAASRDNSAVAALYDSLNPAVLELIGRVVDHGRVTGKEVSLCGDMATEPDGLAALLERGLSTISVPPAALAAVKAAITRFGAHDDG